MIVDYVPDWRGRLLSRLAEQFKGLPNLAALVGAAAEQFQAIEEAGQQLLSISSIDDSEGAQLDTIGGLVGQPRNGIADALYRLYLRARIRANKSGGAPEEIYSVFLAMFANTASMIYTRAGIATFVLKIAAPLLDAPTAAIAVSFLRLAKDAGVRAILEYQGTSDALSFSFDTGPGLGFGDATDPSVGGAFVGAL